MVTTSRVKVLRRLLHTCHVSRTTPPVALHLGVGPGASSGSLTAAVVRALASGQLADGDLLPSTRVLADVLGVRRSRVVEAYQQLVASGYAVTVPGSGTRVESGAAAAARAGAGASFREGRPVVANPRSTSRKVRFDLRPGFPDVTLISARAWSQAWRRGARASLDGADPTRAGGDSAGLLRSALAEHLRVSRGVAVAADGVVLFPGVQAAIRTIARVAVDPGRSLAFESPGYDKALRAFHQVGIATRAVPIDEAGIRVDQLSVRDWGVYVTPAHQFPMGSRMPVSRRRELIEWAERVDGYIFEDDYDGEFRYDVAPMPPVRSMAAGPRRVIYIGTVSKILSREMRIAWAVLPERLRAAVVEEQRRDGDAVNGVAAAALAELISSRALLRHLASSHRTYAARRRRFTEACALELPHARIHGIEAGLHLTLTFDDGFDDLHAVAALDRAGVLCAPLTRYAGPGVTGPSGLVCGYAQLPETRAHAAARVIRDVLA